jgi:hypothetical protein
LGAETHLSVADRRWLSPLALWSGILAGPIAWAIDLEASYALVHWTCFTRRIDVLHAISVGALLLTALGAGISWIAWQHARALPADDDEIARARFMAMLGMWTALLFAGTIVAAAIPRWVLDACQ